jgi:hypothetical protein
MVVYIPPVTLGHINGFVHLLENVGSNHVSLTKKLHLRAVSFQKLAVLSKLSQLDLGHVHQSLDFEFGTFEVFNAECIYGDDSDANLVAYFEDLEVRLGLLERGNEQERRSTLARASKPMLCPSTISMRFFLANLRFPSMTKATCSGTGP